MRSTGLSIKEDASVYWKILFFSGLNIAAAFVLNLILPQKIGVGVYGDYRYLYSLIGFAGLFHLGYLDGYYLLSLEKSVTQKASMGYLGLLICACLVLANMVAGFMGYEMGESALLIALMIVVSNFINFISLSFNIRHSFIAPLATQLLVTLILIICLFNNGIADWLVLHLYQSVLLLLVVQLGILVLIQVGTQEKGSLSIGLGSWKQIKWFHEKGIKTLAIGLVILLGLGLDKLVLKSILPKESFGAYCFSNSFLISFLGLGLSVSNKLVSYLYQKNEEFKEQYNQIVRNISFVSIALIGFGVWITQWEWVENLGYAKLLHDLVPNLGLFPFLLLIQLVYSNLAKVYGLEIRFTLFYLIAIGISFFIFKICYGNIYLMLVLTSLVYYLTMLLLDQLLVKTNCGYQLSIQNKLIAFLPIVAETILYQFYV
jgi:hypothetical protein